MEENDMFTGANMVFVLVRDNSKSAQKFFLHGRLDYPNDETKRNSRKYVKALKPLKVCLFCLLPTRTSLSTRYVW